MDFGSSGNLGVLVIVLAVLVFILLICVIVLMVKYGSIKSSYDFFMRGQNGESLEDQIKNLFNHSLKILNKVNEQKFLNHHNLIFVKTIKLQKNISKTYV